MWPFKRKKPEPSPYLYTFERVGTRPLARSPLVVTADGDATVDSLMKALTVAHGTGYVADCRSLIIRVINVDVPKKWMGDA